MKPFLILVFSSTIAMSNSPTISYYIAMSKPSTHLLEVELRFDGLDASEKALDVSLPAWRSGRYVILDLASGVVEFRALDSAEKTLAWRKTDKTTWRIETNGSSSVRVQYKVFAHEFNLRTRGVNAERAFVDGAAVFMYAEKYRWLPMTLTVVPYGNWRVTTGLDSVVGKKNTFAAPHYDYLADCPLEIGMQRDVSFEVLGNEHVLSITGEGNYDTEKLKKDIARIIETQAAFWGGELPYKRYVFMLALSPSGGGGTEHINSCALGARPFIFKNPETYGNFLGLVSHEYFHTWNVKQLRPAAIDKYDWSKESYSEELWIAEGATSYYDDLLLVRAGLMTQAQYLERLGSAIDMDRSRPGNTKQSLAECSFDAWIKYWKQTKQAANFESDYYARGAAVIFALDMTIRNATENKRSLDDVMREMYKRFPLGKGGYTNADFLKVCEEVGRTTLRQFFGDYVFGAKPLPWKDILAYAGLEQREKDPVRKPWLGTMTTDEGERTKVVRVLAGSPAYEAGVDVDDEIVALDGYRVRTSSLSARIGEMKEGDIVKLTVFRDDQLREFSITLQLPEVLPSKLVRVEKPSSLQRAIFSSWLAAPVTREKK